jgi:hypothetical protein
MKKLILMFVVLLLSVYSFAGKGYHVNFSQPQGNVFELKFKLDNYQLSDVKLQGTVYSRILFENNVVTGKKGFAELPYLHTAVMLDPKKNVNLLVIPGNYVDIPLANPLVPSRGVIYRDQDPSTIPYLIDPKSLTDKWYPGNLAENSAPYILRDIRGTNVYVYPFQYNAKRNILRVYTEITVKLEENSTTPVNPLLQKTSMIVREANAIYGDIFINYDQGSRYDLTVGEVGDILVVITDRDVDAIQPYITWKKEKGYNVTTEIVATGMVVNTTVKNDYDANPNILYVLLVGDWDDIKCNTTGAGRPMDPQVGCVIGDDTYADLAVGRFSGNSPADITIQVNKTVTYEKTPEMGATWYSVATGMASAEGAGIGDDNESDQQHIQTIYTDKLNPFTYTSYNPIYDPGATVDMVSAAVNNGTSILNYCGHGYSQGWGTTGFSNSNVATLTNGNKLPVIISVACDNGDFDLGTCFAEAWLRQSNGGAIIFMGGSISQPWTPPMRGQDYFNDVLIGGYDYAAHPGQSGISTTEQRTTAGSFIFNGLTLMCVESPGDLETAQTWNLFGDPSLQMRTATPAELTLSSTLIMVGIPFTTTVTSSNGPVTNAMVALSQGDLMFRGFTDAAGNVSIEQTLAPGTAKLVVTAFNTETIYEDVDVIPPNGPYVVFDTLVINDGGNGLLDYHETVNLTISLTNVGTSDATNVIATISSSDPYVTLNDTSENYGTIPAGGTITVADGFQITAADTIPDQHMLIFGLHAGDGSQEWTSNFGIRAYAPALEYMTFSISDPTGNNNGRLDPGETADVTITIKNAGSSEAFNITGLLSTVSPYITINSNSMTYGDLAGGATASQVFNVTVDAATPVGHSASFTIDLNGNYSIHATGDFNAIVGQIPVLVLNLEPNNSSAPVIEETLTNLEVTFVEKNAVPDTLSLYASVFVCLGIYSENYILTVNEGQKLADYLTIGGRIYMEGGDTWYYDQLYNPTPVHPMFNITGIGDGSGDLLNIAGQPGSIVDGMTFHYSGEDSYMDQIEAISPGVMMFRNVTPDYGCAVSNDAGIYRTIGTSFEFGGLDNQDFTKDELMIAYLDFFGIPGIWTAVKENNLPSVEVVNYPNPFSTETTIRLNLEKEESVDLGIYNMNGQLVSILSHGQLTGGAHEFKWNASDASGSRVADGIYFYRLQAGDQLVTRKLVLIK